MDEALQGITQNLQETEIETLETWGNDAEVRKDELVSTCSICEERYKQPKVLSCLHVFCAECLTKKLNNASPCNNENGLSENMAGSDKLVLTCPLCNQHTRLWINGTVDELPSDYVLSDMLEAAAISERQVICTSCKSHQNAIARCNDCDSFLCSGCVDAHQSMRCFEKHKVVLFADMKDQNSAVVHKPIYCSVHPTENMKFYCNTCQVPICNECMVSKHVQPAHSYDRLSSVEATQVKELKDLITSCREKHDVYNNIMNGLNDELTELHLQKVNVKGLIDETFQSYKALLEKIKDQLLNSLDEMHSQQEISVMDQLNSLEKTKDKIDDGCTFAERILTNGNALEILLMKKLITAQLTRLSTVPSVSIVGKIEFLTDEKKFEEQVRTAFGRLTKTELANQSSTEADEKKAILSCVVKPHSPLPFDAVGPFEKDLTSSPESLEGFGMAAGMKGPNHLHQLPPTAAPGLFELQESLANLPMSAYAMQGFNIALGGNAHMSTLSDMLLDRGSNTHSPAMSDSGISVDAASCSSSVAAQSSTYGNLFGSIMQQSGGLQKLGGANAIMGGVTPDLSALDLYSGANSLISPMTSELSLASLLNSLGPGTGMGNMFNSGTLGSTGPYGGLPQTGLGLPNNAGSLTQNFGPANNVAAPMHPTRNASKHIAPMQIRCKFGQQGVGRSQFNSPHGFCLGLEDDIVVADTMNHRIIVFDKAGEHKYHFGVPGKEEGQLWYPRKVATFRQSGRYIVCDRGNERSRIQIFMRTGHFVKKIAIRYIDIVAGIAITAQGHIVAVDSVTPTVFCVSEAGDLIRWFDCSEHMREPSDIAVFGREYFVCDFKGHCVVVFSEMGDYLRRIGSESITTFPNGIDVSDAGDILVGDSHGNRFHVAVFQRDGTLVGDFECPYIKVSRCCGLKITSEGFLVTLAKNNHFVLVLNTLYIP